MTSASRSKKLLRGPLSIVGFVAAAALAGAVLFPAAAGAYSRGFQVYNLGGHAIKYAGISSTENGATFDSTPAAGAVLQPGVGYHDFEETYYFGSTTQGTATYQILGDDETPIGTFKPTMQIVSINTNGASCETTLGACTPLPDNGRPHWPASTVTLLDAPGTVHDIPAGQGQAQHDLLAQLCNNNNSASCTFTATREEQIDSPDHQLGHALINNTDEEQDTTVTVEDTVGSKDSVDVGLTAGGKIKGLVEVEVSLKYGHEWTNEHTFSQDVHVHCAAHHKCWIIATAPMLRDTGDFTLTLGNTTWRLHDVYVDSPNPKGNGAYSVNDQALTGQEQANLPQAVIQTGTDGNDNIAGTDADDLISANGGNDMVSGGPGNDRISGGPGRDRISGGPGRDAIFGGPGNDRLSGGPGRDPIFGGPGNDRLSGGPGRDRIFGGPGRNDIRQ
jgi:Ca2+-binding RTX toxin-like protein